MIKRITIMAFVVGLVVLVVSSFGQAKASDLHQYTLFQSPIHDYSSYYIGPFRPGVGDHRCRSASAPQFISPDKYAVDYIAHDAKSLIPIYPTAEGEVIYAKSYQPSDTANYGYSVVIRHASYYDYNNDVALTYYSFYSHLRGDIQVAEGDWVSTDTLLGYMSNSGGQSVVHLHFGVRTSSFEPEGDGAITGIVGPGGSSRMESYNIWRNLPELWEEGNKPDFESLCS